MKKTVLKNFAVVTRKHFSWSLFLMKLQAFSPATLLKKESNTSIFLVKIAKLSRKPILMVH